MSDFDMEMVDVAMSMCGDDEPTPLPTAEEIERDDYCTDQVARMNDKIIQLQAELTKVTALYLKGRCPRSECWRFDTCEFCDTKDEYREESSDEN